MSETHSVVYDKSRFPKQPGKGLCRGCGQSVPKGRKTWCSSKCNNRFNPAFVRFDCEKRDKGICSICHVDTNAAQKRFVTQRDIWNSTPSQYRYFVNGQFIREKFEFSAKIYLRHSGKRHAAAQKRRGQMIAAGWPGNKQRDWWEMDHIIPFSEGGLTVIENVRTLCIICHKHRTKTWHKSRSKQPTESGAGR